LSDAPRFAELVNDLSLARFTARIPHPYTLADAEAFVRLAADEMTNGEERRFAVCRADDIVACVGLRRGGAAGEYELGYWVGANYRGGGVATAAARATTWFGFEKLNARKVTAGHFVDNPASGRILRKIGFRATGETVPTYSLARGCDVATPRFEIQREMQLLTADIAITAAGD
jgi:RimJ/RimL family protein N-acetyltransferase